METYRYNMENIITFTKDGIKVRQTVTNPLMPSRQEESIVPYDGITQYNPLDIRVVGIVPSFDPTGVLKQIELKLADDSPHDLKWFERRVLEMLKDGKTWKKESIYSALEPEFSSSDRKKLRSGGSRGYSNLTTALDSLKKAGSLDNPRKGLWRLK